MSIFKAIKNGFGQTWKYKRILILLYLMTFLLAVFVAYPLKNLLESTVGQSMMVADLVKGFDYTFLNDYKNAYGEGFLPIIDQSITVLVLYLLLFIFFMGGIIATFLQEPAQYDKRIFWGEGAHYFGRIFRLTIYFIFIHLFIFAIFAFIFYKSVSGLSPFELENEATISFAFKIIAPTYILVATFFFVWQDYTKIILVQEDRPWIFQSLWPAMRLVLQNFRKTYGLYLLNLLLWFVVIYANYLISMLISIDSSQSIFISFFISQCFVLARLSLKMINISSASKMYRSLA